MKQLLFFISFFYLSFSQKENFISGTILNELGIAVRDVTIKIPSLNLQLLSNKNGSFNFQIQDSIKVISIIFSHIAYERHTVRIANNDLNKKITIRITSKIYSEREVMVNAGNVMFSNSSSLSIKKYEIENISDPSNDILRRISGIMGIDGDQFHARIGLRGSYFDESKILLDGMELYSPYHLKTPPPSRLEGVISAIDYKLIDKVSVQSSNSPAEYPNTTGGIVELKTKNASLNSHYRFDLTLLHMGAFFEKQWKDMGILISLRRGYFDIVLDILGGNSNVYPVYNDYFLKLNYIINSNNVLTFEMLGVFDQINIYKKGTKKRSLDSKIIDNQNYNWLKWDYSDSNIFSNELILFSSFLPKKMFWNNDNKLINSVDHGNNDKDSEVFGIKNNMFFLFSKQLSLKTGFELKHSDNIYDFQQVFERRIGDPLSRDTISKKIRYTGIDYSIYGSVLYRPFDELSLQTGIRFEDQKYMSSTLTQISPSATARYNFNPTYSLAFSIGSYFLPDNTIDLSYFKNVLTVRKAKHYSLSFRYKLSEESVLIVEPYIKTSSPRHNIIYNKGKRVKLEKGEAKGLDFTYKKANKIFSYTLSYSYIDTYDLSENLTRFNRMPNKTHRFYFSTHYNYKNWIFASTYRLTSGSPYTEKKYVDISGNKTLYKVFHGPYLSAKEKTYSRLDFRIAYNTKIGQSNFEISLDIINFLNTKSIRKRNTDFKRFKNNKFIPFENNSLHLPFLPSLAIALEF